MDVLAVKENEQRLGTASRTAGGQRAAVQFISVTDVVSGASMPSMKENMKAGRVWEGQK